MPSRSPERADLVIVGGGTAGLAAAVTAGELGLRAIVIEKTERLGGQLLWSFGQFSAAGTRRQRSHGIADHPDDHYADVMRIGGQKATPHLVRLAVDQAGPMVDWLEGLGFPFAPECPALVHGHEVYGRPRTYWGKGPRTQGGRVILGTLLAHLDPGICVMLGHRFTDLLVDGGTVRGVRAEGPQGPVEIEAPTTLLTTGGYAANRDLLAQLQPRWPSALVGCLDHATGDAHEVLQRRFATPLVLGDLYVPTMGMIEDPERPGFGLRLAESRVIVDANARPPWELWVNRRGERFVAEDTRSPHHREHRLLEQPDLVMAAVWDQRAVDRGPAVIGPEWSRDDELAEADRGRWLHRADSLEELAARLRVDPAGLRATTEAYNQALREGRDDPLGRSHRPGPVDAPPFYGAVTRGGMLLTRGGPSVDARLRPVTAGGERVDGVRVAGELLGMSQFSGDAFAGGMSVGPALALGRWLVQEAAGGAVGR